MKLLNYLNNSTRDKEEYYILSPEEAKQLKSCLLSIYTDIDNVCKKYGLVCMLAGGSALGAVRHNGFIPWDDDMDLIMPRNDYNKLIEVFDKELSHSYDIASPTHGEPNYFLQIIKKNTSVRYLNSVSDSGVLIDIFPIDKTPKSSLMRYVLHYLSIICRGILFSVKTYKAKDLSMKKVMSRKIGSRFLYYILMSIGFIFSIIPVRRWCILCDKIISVGGKSNYSTVAVGRNLYIGELLNTHVFLPPSEGIFEGLKVSLPHDVKAYLKKLYGSDYMQLPPEDKRETHAYISFYIG